jgi:hypothetical protein
MRSAAMEKQRYVDFQCKLILLNKSKPIAES